MFKRVALMAAVAMFMAMDIQAGIFGSRGGCPNGQCGMRATSQQVAKKVAVQSTETPPQPVAQVAATEANTPALSATTLQNQQVASQTTRTRLLRRWSR